MKEYTVHAILSRILPPHEADAAAHLTSLFVEAGIDRRSALLMVLAWVAPRRTLEVLKIYPVGRFLPPEVRL